MTKDAEKRWRDITNHYEWYRHKYGDVRYCIHCKQPLPKSENAPDFYTALVGTWVEAKNSGKSGAWNWYDDIGPQGKRQKQRDFLLENDGWLFIEFDDAAYLLPFKVWVNEIEWKLEKVPQHSIRATYPRLKDGTVYHGYYEADVFMKEYRLEWVRGVGWDIPACHPWWMHFYKELREKTEEAFRHTICQSRTQSKLSI